jgi:hypothetical protein
MLRAPSPFCLGWAVSPLTAAVVKCKKKIDDRINKFENNANLTWQGCHIGMRGSVFAWAVRAPPFFFRGFARCQSRPKVGIPDAYYFGGEDMEGCWLPQSFQIWKRRE